MIFSSISQSSASEPCHYAGIWKSDDGKVEMTFKENGRCILTKKKKIVTAENECTWDRINGSVSFTHRKHHRKDMFYFKLDNNELIIEQDKRSLTREKADLIMHRVK